MGGLRRWFNKGWSDRFRLCYGLLALGTCMVVAACGGNTALNSSSNSPENSSSPAPAAQSCYTVTHMAGETEICDRPEKIAVLDTHSLDVLLGLKQQPAGVVTPVPLDADRVEHPEVFIPSLGDRITTTPAYLGSFGQPPSLETLLQLKPDLVVGEVWSVQAISDAMLSEVAPTVSLFPRSEPGNWRDNIRVLAQALGDERLADQAIAQYDKELETTRKALANVTATHPKVLLVGGDGFKRGVLLAVTENSFMGEIVEDAGFDVISPLGIDRSIVPLSLELLPELNEADLVFVLGYSADAAKLVPPLKTLETMNTDELLKERDAIIAQQTAVIKADWESSAIAQSLEASQKDRVYFYTYYEWNILNGPVGAESILQQLRQSLPERIVD
ncbi:MAG: ABC transporter substrate-binding protein [Cyanobacteria bacterium P01_C01_bin.89]